MYKNFVKIFELLENGLKALPVLLLLFLLNAFFDLLGIGMLIPIISMLVTNEIPEIFQGIGDYLVFRLDFVEEISIALAGIFFITFLTKCGLSLYSIAKITDFANRQRTQLGVRLLNSIFEKEFSEHIKKNESDIIYEIQSATGDYYTSLIIYLKMASEIITLSAILTMLILVEPFITAVAFAMLLVPVSIYASMTNAKLKSMGKKRNEHETKLMDISQNALRGLREIKLLNKGGYFTRMLEVQITLSGKINVILAVFASLPRQLLEVLIVSILLSSLILKSFIGVGDDIYLFTLTLFSLSALRILPILSSLLANYGHVSSLRNSVDRIYSSVAANEKTGEKALGISLDDRYGCFEKLELVDLTFKYPEHDHTILDKVSFKIEKGEVLGIIGLSGSGKSTLLSIICGFLEPVSGIRIFKASAGKQPSIGFLQSESFMMNGSIKDNIVLQNVDGFLNDLNFKSSLKASKLEELQNELSSSLSDKIGQAGGRISAGQRQRLALARHIFHESSLLVLDEATNAIDVNTEKLIFENLQEHRNKGAVVVVSHRASTLQYCDKVFLLADGKLLEVEDAPKYLEKKMGKNPNEH